MRSDTNVALESDNALKMLRLLDSLEELDDVQKVYSNGSISEELLMTLENQNSDFGLVLILGVDPGSRATGYGIIEVLRNKLVHVDSGTFRLDQVSLQARLLMLHENLSLVIERNKPSEASVEKVFVNRNVDSALKLGHARGVILLNLAKQLFGSFTFNL